MQLRVASANLNQTIANFTTNVPRIKAAIDAAVQDGADVLALQELGLTGYTGDDYFKWIRSDAQQQEILEVVKDIADYAAAKNPNLVISLGFPLFYADKEQPVKVNLGTEDKPVLVPNPLYNIHGRPYNAQAVISGGKMCAVSLKSIQPDGAAEYEPRQFTSWHDYLPVQEITLPLFGAVKVGTPVVQLADGKGNKANLYQEICAEGWPGIYDDGSVNEKEARDGRHLNRVAQTHDISLVLNPSASKPEPYLNKPQLRATLAKLGSDICHGAGYVYTNCLGLEAAPTAFEGGSVYVENGEVVHRSRRYSMADVEYSSSTLSLPDLKRDAADVVVPHVFNAKASDVHAGGPDAFEAVDDDFQRRSEETLRNTALWIRDYLRKTELQGFIISLSGGADSAFGAVMVSQAIDLNIQQLEEASHDKARAVADFINQFPHLKYREEVLKAIETQGTDAAIDLIKNRMLTCIYLPSDNSGHVTLNAARTLIEGGTVHGKPVKGIGGKFEVVNVQATVDSFIEAFAGLVHKDAMAQTIDDPVYPGEKMNLLVRVKQEIKQYVSGSRTEFSPAVEDALKQKDSGRRLSWRNAEDDITLQNIQARARQPYPWMFANKEHKIACVTSNWSEAVAGYWTFGGDGHMGAINLCGGVPKSHLKAMLRYLEHDGLHGLPPVKALNPVNEQIPTAELRPTEQSDEADMMPYKMLDAIGEAIFFYKKTPLDAYRDLQTARDPNDPSRLLFATHDDANTVDKAYLITCIEKACRMWHRSQFKRVASVVAPFLGQNVDPHNSVRTTILSDGFETALAELKIQYLTETLGEDFAAKTGMEPQALRLNSKIKRDLRDVVNKTPIEELPAALTEYDPHAQRSALTVGGI